MALATPNARDRSTPNGSNDDPDKLHGASNASSAASDDEDATPNATVLEPGIYVDRYRILEVVGTGGIGVVYAAADEALGRKVAIKLLRPSARSSAKFERRRARLIREAQALARLSHPNVVPVYEVGMFEDRVYLAMEFVEGLTMRRWLRRSQRSWAEILDRYVQAGRGLAAAHAADIVHRDFKPDNVLVGHDGRVRVLDFGLATPVPDPIATGRYPTIEAQQLALERTGRIRVDDLPRKRPRPSTAPLTDSAASLITAHGKIMGTPAYMSPEQSRGEPIDARSDQFSFCVALWEAMFGERPHGPLSATDRIRTRSRTHRSRSHRRATDAEHGQGEREPGGVRNNRDLEVPAAIQAALERGLSLDPHDRFPDMDSLLTALERRPSHWRRWLLVAGLPVATALAVVAGLVAPSMADPCPRDATGLDGVWDPQIRERAHTQLTATARPYANASWTAIEHGLDRWTKQWLDARVDACEATKVRREQSPVLLDVRLACLDRQANALRAVTESLASDSIVPDVDRHLEAALAAVLALPDPSRCGRAAVLGTGLAGDPLLDGARTDQRLDLARARGLLDIAKHAEALAVVDAVLASINQPESKTAGRIGDPGVDLLHAEAKLTRGRILAAAGRLQEADKQLRAAVFAAQTAGHDEVSVEACAALVDLLQAQAKLDDAEDWAQLGRATLARLGGDPHLEAELRSATARLARERGDFEASLADQQRVLELREQLDGAEHVEVAKILSDLVSTKTELGRFDEAQADISRALTILTRQLGFTHPQRGLALSRHAALQHARGLDREALSMYFDILAIFELAYGGDHPHLAMTFNNIAVAHASLGEHREALTALQRAHAMLVSLHGAGHPKTSATVVNIAMVLYELGHADEAGAELDRAEGFISASLGTEHVTLAVVHFNHAEIDTDQGRYAEALARYRKAHGIWLANVEPSNPMLGLVLGSIAKVEHLRGNVEGALGLQREALAQREAALGDDHPDLALHLTWIGVGLLDLGHLDEAQPHLARAIGLIDANERSQPELLGTARLALAELIWQQASDAKRHPPARKRAEARELARAAIGDFAELGERQGGVAKLDRAKTWLSEH